MINKINRGDIFVYDFGLDYSTNIECKKRPALIVSNNKGNTYGPTCLVAPITTRPYEKQKIMHGKYIFKTMIENR